MNSCIEAFKNFTKVVKEENILPEAINAASGRYCLKAYDIKEIDVEWAEEMFKSIQEKYLLYNVGFIRRSRWGTASIGSRMSFVSLSGLLSVTPS